MGKIIDSKECEQLQQFFSRNKNIVGVYIFGSYNTEYYNDNSDIDFGIVFDEKVELFNELEVADAMSEILGTDNIDVVNLKKTPVTFQHKAVSTGKLIYESDYKKMSDYLENIIKFYCDYQYNFETLQKEYTYALKEEYLNA